MRGTRWTMVAATAGLACFLAWTSVSLMCGAMPALVFHVGFAAGVLALWIARRRMGGAALPGVGLVATIALCEVAATFVPVAGTAAGWPAVVLMTVGGIGGGACSAHWFRALGGMVGRRPVRTVLLAFALSAVVRVIPFWLLGVSGVAASAVLAMCACASSALLVRCLSSSRVGEAPSEGRSSRGAGGAVAPHPLVETSAYFAIVGFVVGLLRQGIVGATPDDAGSLVFQVVPLGVFLALYVWERLRDRGLATQASMDAALVAVLVGMLALAMLGGYVSQMLAAAMRVVSNLAIALLVIKALELSSAPTLPRATAYVGLRVPFDLAVASGLAASVLVSQEFGTQSWPANVAGFFVCSLVVVLVLGFARTGAFVGHAMPGPGASTSGDGFERDRDLVMDGEKSASQTDRVGMADQAEGIREGFGGVSLPDHAEPHPLASQSSPTMDGLASVSDVSLLIDDASLTAREAQVATLFCQGLSKQQIGEALSITEGTVRFHIKQVYQKLDVHSRSELILHAVGKR